MEDRLHYVNSKKLKISVISYLILEYMHYHDTHLNFLKPKNIGYIGIDVNLFKFTVKQLYDKKLIIQFKEGDKGDFKLSASTKKRLDRLVGTKNDYETLFENQFKVNYPNKTGMKAAKVAFMKIPLSHNSNTIQDILDGIELRKKWEKEAPEGEFLPRWPMPATYLNGERWKDKFEPWQNKEKESNTLTYTPNNKEVL